jgi:hypothetical protein
MMKTAHIPHYFSLFPTGNIPVPVCIGDLLMAEYHISLDVTTEQVTAYLDANPSVPGAIVLEGKRVRSVIPRAKMFERLGRRYGVELFMRKPILDMEKEIGAQAFILKSHLPVNTAVKMALSRAEDHIYDPVIVEFEDGSTRLLDMYVLLLSQSQLSINLSGIVTSLNTIEMMLTNENQSPASTFDLVMESLNKVVPTHHLCIILRQVEVNTFVHNLVRYQNEPLESNSVYRSVLAMNQAVVLEDVRIVPAWANWDTPQNTRSWLGAPVTHRGGTMGLISLARTSFSPFTNHEKEIVLVFARYIGKLFENITFQLERRLQLENKYRSL